MFQKHAGELVEIEGAWEWIPSEPASGGDGAPAAGGEYEAPQHCSDGRSQIYRKGTNDRKNQGFWFREAKVVDLPTFFYKLKDVASARQLYVAYNQMRVWAFVKPRSENKTENAVARRAAAVGRHKRTGRWGWGQEQERKVSGTADKLA